MKDIPSTINKGLIFDGMLFASPRDRCLYIGITGNKYRERRWLEQNRDKWILLKNVPQTTAPECEMDVRAAGDSSVSEPSERKDEGIDGSAETSAIASPLAEHVGSTVASATAALSLSEIGKNKIAIDGNECVSTLCFASMLGVSERTLSLLLANGKAPPYAKIAGNYYPLDTVREWAAAMGLVLKTPSDNY